MSSIHRLTELSALSSAAFAPDEAVQRAVLLLQEELSADDVFLVYGTESSFRCFGTCSNMKLDDTALWFVNRDLTSRGGPCNFDLRDGRVVEFRNIGSRRPCDYAAALIPTLSSTAEMLVVRGSWPRGLGAPRGRFLQAALPGVALLLERRLDFSRAQRQRSQVNALANITRVMSESEDLEMVLTGIAGTIATVTGIDYICIDLVDADGSVSLRCINSTRPGVEQLQIIWKQAKNRPDAVRDAVLSSRQPMTFPDAQTDERIPDGGRNYFVRTLLRSTATFPLLAKDEVLGVLSVASHRPLEFTATEVELLEGLAAQVATAIQGIQLYQKLAESREELQESMRIEHHVARTDALTGLPNRRYIEEAMEAECARAGRYGQPVCVAMADLDYFKQINDGYGHQTGDDALKFVAGLARDACRAADLVSRWGGDEFVFILPSTTMKNAKRFAERFRQALAGAAFTHPKLKKPARMTISLGVAQAGPDTFANANLLLERADKALYAAKAAGRNRTMVADGEAAHAA